jgi:superfamily II DNA or RNA helicase
MTSLLATPEIRPTDWKLRDYQLRAINDVRHEFARGKKSTLIVCATGVGKSVILGMIARRVAERGGRTLVIAHRGELIEQLTETLTRLGLSVGIEKGESYARSLFEPHAVVATVQTMKGERLKSWPRDYFKLVVTDEAHHATATSYQNIYKNFDAIHLGVTATPDRADGDSLGDVYESVAFEYSMWDAMTAPEPGPYLSRLRFVQCDVGVDLREISTTGKADLNVAELEEAIKPHVETLANAIKQEIGTRRTLIFTPDVGSTMAMASALYSIGVAAKWVAGDSPDRSEVIGGFRRGDFQVLSNCALATEGFDCPEISAVVLCRPTKSRALFSQMCGRGTRLSLGKDHCLIVDFNWLTETHDLVTPVELFDTTHTDSETMDIANAMLKDGGSADPSDGDDEAPEDRKGLDLMDVIERAEAEKKRRTVLRVQARERQIKYRKVSYDPLTAMETLGMPVRKEAASLQGTITDRQRETLEKFGVTGMESCSKRRASALIDTLMERSRLKLCSHKQIAHLIRNGVPAEEARAMSKAQASEFLSNLWGDRDKPSPAVPTTAENRRQADDEEVTTWVA